MIFYICILIVNSPCSFSFLALLSGSLSFTFCGTFSRILLGPSSPVSPVRHFLWKFPTLPSVFSEIENSAFSRSFSYCKIIQSNLGISNVCLKQSDGVEMRCIMRKFGWFLVCAPYLGHYSVWLILLHHQLPVSWRKCRHVGWRTFAAYFQNMTSLQWIVPNHVLCYVID